MELPERRFNTSATGVRRAIVLVFAIIFGIVLINSIRTGSVVSSTSTLPSTSTVNLTVPPVSTTTTSLPSPTSFTVQVANGSQVPNAAGHFTNILRNMGYTVLAARDTISPETSSYVYYLPGAKADAIEVAGALQIPTSSVAAMPATPPVATMGTAEVLVVLGPTIASQATSTTS